MTRYTIDVLERHVLEDPEDRVIISRHIVCEDLDTGLTDKIECVVEVRDETGRTVLRFLRAAGE